MSTTHEYLCGVLSASLCQMCFTVAAKILVMTGAGISTGEPPAVEYIFVCVYFSTCHELINMI